nr:metallophosphoesterase [uncultured Allomuricauda sp.]
MKSNAKNTLKFRLWKLLILLLLVSSCKEKSKVIEEKEVLFVSDVANGPKPWTSENFETTEDDFTFAIISDLNGGEREGVYSTAVSQLNRLDPTFVLSVGDLIDGGTEDSLQLAKEWDSFDQRTSKLNMPFFYLGGNHDLTNPKMRDFWKNRFGPRYYHFLYDDVLFLMMDSEDYEEKRMLEIYHARAEAIKIISGEIEGIYEESEYFGMDERRVGGMSNDQFDYFKTVLEKYPDVKWIFVLMHKPLWMREDEKGLGNLETLLTNRPYTVINGHFHSFSHRKRKGRDYTILGTTGGGQDKTDSLSFDHVTLVRMAKEPIITHLKMEGILDETGSVPEQ